MSESENENTAHVAYESQINTCPGCGRKTELVNGVCKNCRGPTICYKGNNRMRPKRITLQFSKSILNCMNFPCYEGAPDMIDVSPLPHKVPEVVSKYLGAKFNQYNIEPPAKIEIETISQTGIKRCIKSALKNNLSGDDLEKALAEFESEVHFPK